MVQWLRLCLLIQRVQIRSLVRELTSHMPFGQKKKKKNWNIKQKQYCNKFNKDFENDPHQKKDLKKGGNTPWCGHNQFNLDLYIWLPFSKYFCSFLPGPLKSRTALILFVCLLCFVFCGPRDQVNVSLVRRSPRTGSFRSLEKETHKPGTLSDCFLGAKCLILQSVN